MTNRLFHLAPELLLVSKTLTFQNKTMGSSAAEKNRRKRERKKNEKEVRRKLDEVEKKHQILSENAADKVPDDDIEIEYVSEDLQIHVDSSGGTTTDSSKTSLTALPDGLPPVMTTDGGDLIRKERSESEIEQEQQNSIEEVLRRFHERASVSNDNSANDDNNNSINDDQGSIVSDDDDSYENDTIPTMSKRKLRNLIRPSISDLKSRVPRPDLVEAHDVTAADPDFLITLKSVPKTTPVPFHWGRKRKYLQGKRGLDKPPFQLPDFIIKTGITDVRDTAMEDEAKQSAKQKNRGRVNPKMGSMDVDYKILYEAFFKYQTKPKKMTSWGNLYYEGKELETSTDIKPGGPFSRALKIALGIAGSKNVPPPWLWNMQRFGPPPSHPRLKIPGLNAPLPNPNCQYGYHPGGWGKPPVDSYGRPLYGGNPLGAFSGSNNEGEDDDGRELVTSDGKTVRKSAWGSLPVGGEYIVGGDGSDDDDDDDDTDSSSSEEEESDADDMDMDSAVEETDDTTTVGTESVLPPPLAPKASGIDDLRKQPGDETPVPPPKLLYQVIKTGGAEERNQSGIFQSDIRYLVPGGGGAVAAAAGSAAPVPEGAESVLSKAVAPLSETSSRKKRKQNKTEDDEEEFDKSFKF